MSVESAYCISYVASFWLFVSNFGAWFVVFQFPFLRSVLIEVIHSVTLALYIFCSQYLMFCIYEHSLCFFFHCSYLCQFKVPCFLTSSVFLINCKCNGFSLKFVFLLSRKSFFVFVPLSTISFPSREFSNLSLLLSSYLIRLYVSVSTQSPTLIILHPYSCVCRVNKISLIVECSVHCHIFLVFLYTVVNLFFAHLMSPVS